MGYGPWAMGFKRSAARHYVVIGAPRLAGFAGMGVRCYAILGDLEIDFG